MLCCREVLRCTMVTHQVLLRGAAQCFLLSSALCLTDVVRQGCAATGLLSLTLCSIHSDIEIIRVESRAEDLQWTLAE